MTYEGGMHGESPCMQYERLCGPLRELAGYPESDQLCYGISEVHLKLPSFPSSSTSFTKLPLASLCDTLIPKLSSQW